jgi:hypothetical protein
MGIRGAVAIAVVIGLSLAGVSTAFGATPRAGTLDSSFGTHGVVKLRPAATPPGSTRDPKSYLLTFAYNKLWVGGDQRHGAYAVPLSPTGQALTTFQHGKPVVAWWNDEFYVGLRTILPTSDGGAILVIQQGDPSAVSVIRLKADGNPDASWGDYQGRTYLTPRCGDCDMEVTGAVRLANGRIRVMGTYTDQVGGTSHAVVVGFTSSGAPDTTIAQAGWRIVDGSPDARTLAVGADSSGRLYLVLDDAGQPDLLRTTPDGVIDPTYHTGGVVPMTLPDGRTLSYPGNAAGLNESLATLVVSPSGETYVGVNTKTSTLPVRWQAVLFHVNAHGYSDQSFGPGRGGFPTFALLGGSGAISAMHTDGRGHFLLALTYWDGTHFLHLLLQITGEGDPDSHFGHHAAVPTATYVAALARGPNHLMYATGWPTKGRTNNPAGRSQVTAYVD